jgi:hypothetical protein
MSGKPGAEPAWLRRCASPQACGKRPADTRRQFLYNPPLVKERCDRTSDPARLGGIIDSTALTFTFS